MSLPIQFQIKCPSCSQSDQTILIEDLFFGLIEKDQKVIARFSIQPDQIKSLIRKIKPPTLERLPIWLIIPPDVLISIFVGIISYCWLLFLECNRNLMKSSHFR
ncbi:MAG: hypothetical protein CVU41_08590 [Chloroflexi bacterium HGW-Chloroflexi-3]|nr:MAG: hypothetical protein CVU41_08590 [Chloroflexi bacterium HGW-Chloroflexi-3]